MQDGKAQNLFERIIVPIVVEQLMSFLQTKRCDETVDRPPHRPASRPERAIISSGRDGEIDPAGRKDLTVQQLSLHSLRKAFVGYALKHFTEDHIGEPEPFAMEIVFQPIHMRRSGSTEKVDPHGGIDNDHEATFTRPARI